MTTDPVVLAADATLASVLPAAASSSRWVTTPVTAPLASRTG